MLEIIFEDEYDTAAFLHLAEHLDSRHHMSIQQGKNRLLIATKESEEALVHFVRPLLVHFFLECKENERMRSILENTYLFKDPEEQHQILSIAHSLIKGDIDDIPGIHQEPSRELLLKKELETLSLQQGIFSIGSFMRFRLSEYDERLKHYVEVAIEEYKMEQEYQNFIQSLRDYVMKREPKLDKVHVVHQDRLLIWEFRYASERDQKQYIDRQFVREHPMYIDSQLIAPLVSIAPEKIALFTNDTGHSMVQTIQNIFQERVEVFPPHAFQEQNVRFVHDHYEKKNAKLS
ncbi:putative sporulation protein YtxC [Bacillus sp. 179-C3.3 HS]|uniref:putative sporulation protein YtxC n=1 Tax=Bacillus sp. 179-C3.3 HS TaxID=3232162 RepID=UPI0039A35EE6